MRGGAALLLLYTLSFGYAQPVKKVAHIDSLLREYSRLEHLNGSVLVAEKGKIIYQQAFGKANFEWGIDNTPATKFRIASISKTFTAVLTFLLCQEGRLQLSDKVSLYLPDFPGGNRMTIEQLLSHRAGIIDHRDIRRVYDNQYGMSRLSREEMVAIFKDSALRSDPGTAWRYSNFGYNLVAVIIEKATGKSFADVLREKILVPLNMQNTTTLENRDVIDKLSDAYDRTYDDLGPARYFDASMMVGAGNMISTTQDLFTFFDALGKDRLLKSSYREKFYSISFRDENGSPTAYSTWFFKQARGKSDSTQVLFAAGNHFGTHALAYDCMEDDKKVIMLLNIRSGKLFEMADNILNILYGLPADFPRDSYVRWLAKDIRQSGIKTAIERFRKNKEVHKDKWTHQPRDLNRLGNYFMEKGRLDVAVAIFKLNLEYFSDEGDFYDSLGEAYFKLGDAANATINLEKAIELDPTNDHAKDLLNKLQKK